MFLDSSKSRTITIVQQQHIELFAIPYLYVCTDLDTSGTDTYSNMKYENTTDQSGFYTALCVCVSLISKQVCGLYSISVSRSTVKTTTISHEPVRLVCKCV